MFWLFLVFDWLAIESFLFYLAGVTFSKNSLIFSVRKWSLSSHRKWSRFFYALGANIFSFCLGWVDTGVLSRRTAFTEKFILIKNPDFFFLLGSIIIHMKLRPKITYNKEIKANSTSISISNMFFEKSVSSFWFLIFNFEVNLKRALIIELSHFEFIFSQKRKSTRINVVSKIE